MWKGPIWLAAVLFSTGLQAHERYRDGYISDRYNKKCRETQIITGNQHLTVDGAKKAANDAWAGQVRFRFGEVYMDLSNAAYVVYTCSRSSIGEPGLSTLGQTLTRCEIEAKPCKAGRQKE